MNRYLGNICISAVSAVAGGTIAHLTDAQIIKNLENQNEQLGDKNMKYKLHIIKLNKIISYYETKYNDKVEIFEDGTVKSSLDTIKEEKEVTEDKEEIKLEFKEEVEEITLELKEEVDSSTSNEEEEFEDAKGIKENSSNELSEEEDKENSFESLNSEDLEEKREIELENEEPLRENEI